MVDDCNRIRVQAKQSNRQSRVSVANAVVYSPNWATLGRWPKIGLLFILLPAAALFSNLTVSWQFRKFLSPFIVQEHSIYQFQGLRVLKTSWRAINIDCPLHKGVKSLIVLRHWAILSVLLLKSIQIWEIGRIFSSQKLGCFEVPCRR